MFVEAQQNHILMIEDDQGQRELLLKELVYSIGRDARCDIRLFSQFVSRRHATLVQLPNDDGTYYYRIMDGNLKGGLSANGLLINSRKLRQHNLQSKDEIIFAPQVKLTYYLLDGDIRLDRSLHGLDTTISPLDDLFSAMGMSELP
jgi:pSer/pThr/pTyr-binding forkhead associated (FHA) protein